MAFMTSRISTDRETWVIAQDTEYPVNTQLPPGDYRLYSDRDVEQLAATLGLDPDDVATEVAEYGYEFSIVDAYVGYFAADGYIDRSFAVFGETQAEVAEQLIEWFYEYREREDLDSEELEDLAFLEEIANGAE